MTLDDCIPAPDWFERHSRVIAAPPDVVLAATRAVTIPEMPLAAVLLALRGFGRPPRIPFTTLLEKRVTARGAGTLVCTETRIAATSDDARRIFGRYWRIVRPGSGLVRHSLLRAVERRALTASPPSRRAATPAPP